jgi:hypothetical protein
VQEILCDSRDGRFALKSVPASGLAEASLLCWIWETKQGDA